MKKYKIYLDQKDYSSIARGLIGEKGLEVFPDIFDFLKPLVESGRITIYFSWCHIVESLRYGDLSSELWNKHCEVVDTLTGGNCTIFPLNLENRELEIFLSKTFKFKSKFSETEYPFGKYKDSISMEKIYNIHFDESYKESLHKHILGLGLPRNERRRLIKNLSKKRNIISFFNNMSDKDYEKLVNNQKDTDFNKVLAEDIRETMDRETFIKFVYGNKKFRAELIESFFDQIHQFKRLINVYSRFFPELRKIGHIPESSMQKINPTIISSQMYYDMFSKPLINPKKLKIDLTKKWTKDLKPSINKYAKKHKFFGKDAEKVLLDTNLKPISSLHSTILCMVEYVKRHGGGTIRGRKPRESDFIDLQNLRNLPYVDIYLTDSFFADIAEKIGIEEFGTKVLKNLVQLKDHLKKDGFDLTP